MEAAEAQWPALPPLGSESPHSPAWGPEVLSICLYAALPLSGLAWDLHPPPGWVLFEGRNQPVFFVIVWHLAPALPPPKTGRPVALISAQGSQEGPRVAPIQA